MKTLTLFPVLFVIMLSSCSMETFFTVGVSLPSGFSHLARRQLAKTGEPYDVIIVPGIPYDPTKNSSIMTVRILWAKYLYENGIARNIIFSGSAVYSPYIEGIAMKIIADSLGIPSEHTFFEIKSEHSTENVYYSWKMAKEMGFQRIALATDPFQSWALRGFIKKYCQDVVSIPAVYSRTISGNSTLPAIDLNAAYVNDFVSLLDRESFATRLEGTRGFRVAEEERKRQFTNFLTPLGPSLTKR